MNNNHSPPPRACTLGLVATLLCLGAACSAGPEPPVAIPSAPKPSSTTLPSATAAAPDAPCRGVFIEPRKLCQQDQPLARRVPQSRARPRILVLPDDWSSVYRLPERITDDCFFTAERSVLPPEGLELVVRLPAEGPPVVVKADDQLSAKFLACAAQRARQDHPHASKERVVTIVLYQGEVEYHYKLLDSFHNPAIYVTVLRADAPLSQASAHRLIAHNAHNIRSCFESTFDAKAPTPKQFILNQGVRQSSVEVEIEIERDGSTSEARAKPSPPGATALASCVERAHNAITSSIVGEPFRVRVLYVFRGQLEASPGDASTIPSETKRCSVSMSWSKKSMSRKAKSHER